MLKTIVLAALAASTLLSSAAVAADKPIEARATEAAERVCPIIARSSPATLEYNIDQLTRELDRAGYTAREQRLVVAKCRNWRA